MRCPICGREVKERPSIATNFIEVTCLNPSCKYTGYAKIIKQEEQEAKK